MPFLHASDDESKKWVGRSSPQHHSASQRSSLQQLTFNKPTLGGGICLKFAQHLYLELCKITVKLRQTMHVIDKYSKGHFRGSITGILSHYNATLLKTLHQFFFKVI